MLFGQTRLKTKVKTLLFILFFLNNDLFLDAKTIENSIKKKWEVVHH